MMAPGDGEHGGIVDRVAEDDIGRGDAGAMQGGDLAFIGGDVDELAGGDAVRDLDARGEDAVGGDVEALDALFNDPIVGRTDSPDVAAAALDVCDECGELGEDAVLDVPGEEGGGGGAECGEREAAIDLDHLSADGELGYFAAEVAGVAAVEPGNLRWRDKASVDAPTHEGGAGIAGPECAVTIEDGDTGGEGVDAGVELWGGKGLKGGLHLTMLAGVVGRVKERAARAKRYP
jgi:hypothetical protein